MAKILIVDDQRSIRNTIKELLEMESHSTLTAGDAMEALEIIEREKIDMVISDIKMPTMDGIELLSKIKATHPDIAVIMISGHGDILTAVDCMHKGAYDFIEKPIEMNRLLVTVRNGLERHELLQETKILRRRVTGAWEIIGQSPQIEQIKQIIDKVAASDSRVLINGKNGTGKELVARNIHLSSKRAGGPFVEVNCAAIPSELIESELFGHEKGSFTSAHKQRKGKFEQAEGGTIFLDEIGDMSLSAQAKVLRVLQERKISRVGSDKDIDVDVRVVAATNKSLSQEIAKGNFREDLYHRIAVIVVTVPQLSERREDIPILIDHFIKTLGTEMGITGFTISMEAMEALKNLPFTGNIRELRNVVERLMILCTSPITVDDINRHALSNE